MNQDGFERIMTDIIDVDASEHSSVDFTLGGPLLLQSNQRQSGTLKAETRGLESVNQQWNDMTRRL